MSLVTYGRRLIAGAAIALLGGACAVPAPSPEAGPEAAAVGEVLVLAPNARGEVRVNGKVVGFPPVVATGVPVGLAVIEIWVDGTMRRQERVEVVKGERVTLQMP